MPNRSPLRVLLVDDDIATLRGLSLWLTDKGYDVIPVGTMQGALQFAVHSRFDVLISDIGLPDGDGWDLIRRLRKQAVFHAVAISGLIGERETEMSLSAGFSGHIEKPFALETLQSFLRLFADTAATA